MQRVGWKLLVIGSAVLLCPMFGVHTRYLDLLGGRPEMGIGLAIVGGILLCLGSSSNRRPSAPASAAVKPVTQARKF